MRLALLTLAAGASGAAALTYEVLWVRRLGEVTGSTTIAVYVVLAVFFAGLGVGARIGGRIADRFQGRIRVFCAMEAIIAVSALLFLPTLGVVERAYGAVAPAEWARAPALAIQSLVAIVALAIPTCAMGGTIPALVRHVVTRGGDLAARIGWIYGVNTLGGAAGVALAIFVLFPRVSVQTIAGAGVALNIVAVLLAAAGRFPPRAATPPHAEAGTAHLPRRALLVAAALMGLGSVGLEVLWTRALSQRFLSTVYSFATILLVYLACLGLGALIAPILDRLRLVTKQTFAIVVLLAGLASLGSVVLLGLVPGDLAYGAAPDLSFGARQKFELVNALLVMALPLLAFGVAFPIVTVLARRDVARTGGDVGAVYLANTVGAVTAPALIGLLILPRLGLERSLLALGWLLVVGGAGLLILWRARRKRPLLSALVAPAAIALAVGLTVVGPRDLRLYKHGADDELVDYVEGISSSIAVVREPDGHLFLKIDNSYRLGSARSKFAQHRQGLLPLLLHPDPETALFIGMGTGSSAGAAAAHGDVAVDVLEIVPELTRLLTHFDDINEQLASRAETDPDVRLLTVDARQFVRTTRRRYDVVIGDLFVPWRAGEGSMYTREHFAAVRNLLSEDGIFCHWLPIYQLRPDELRSITATMLDVFPHVDAYWLYFNTTQPCIGLVASARAVTLDDASLSARLRDPVLRGLFTTAGYTDVRSVLGGWIADRPTLDAWSRGAPLETRDRPLIEFLAPMRELDRRSLHATSNVRSMLELVAEADVTAPYARLSEQARRSAEHYRSGMSHYLMGQLDSRAPERLAHAIARYAAACMELPDVSLVQVVLADAVQAAVSTRRFEAARPGIQALIRVRATSHVGHYFDAQVALTRDDPESARDALRAALRAEPEHDASWELLREIERRWPGLEDPEPYPLDESTEADPVLRERP